MSKPTDRDFARYASLVQRVRRARGLQPLPEVLSVDDPRPFIRQMEQELGILPNPDTIREHADHIEIEHERELAPGETNLRTLHRGMHLMRQDWGHTHA